MREADGKTTADSALLIEPGLLGMLDYVFGLDQAQKIQPDANQAYVHSVRARPDPVTVIMSLNLIFEYMGIITDIFNYSKGYNIK